MQPSEIINNQPASTACVNAWIRVAHARGLRYTDRLQILKALDFVPERLFDSSVAQQRLDAVPPLSAKLAKWIDDAPGLDTSADLRWLDDERNTLLTLADSRYPTLLREIADPPLVLYVTGDLATLDRPQLAIVGSRNATRDGMSNAQRFAGELAAAGLGITSGLAVGIDGAAHAAALAAGGTTAAVMATGPNLIYPRQHHKLADAIARNGVLVTEFRCDTRARPSHFARRNRLISGLSLGTLVVEGAEKSGSMITARLAGTQGRDVFAVPGPVGVSQYTGCHRLIREGAMLVDDPSQLIADLGWRDSVKDQTGICARPSALPQGHDPAHASARNETVRPLDFEENCQSPHALLAHIGYSPVSVDVLATTSGFTIAQLSAEVITLEVQGLVNTLPGGFVVRSSRPPNKLP